MGKRGRKRYGVILVDSSTNHCLVLKRIPYLLANRLKNVVMEEVFYPFIMYPGVLHECSFEFPKGSRERRESPLAAAIREFKEESGIKLNPSLKPKRCIYQSYRSSNGISYETLYYLFDFESIDTFRSEIVQQVGWDMVLWTQWKHVRGYFTKMKLYEIVKGVDDYFKV